MHFHTELFGPPGYVWNSCRRHEKEDSKGLSSKPKPCKENKKRLNGFATNSCQLDFFKDLKGFIFINM